MLRMNLVSAAAFSSRVSLFKLAASAVLFYSLGLCTPMEAQSADAVRSSTGVASRLTAPIVEGSRVTIQGAVHPLANKANDRGQLADGTKLERMQIVLKRSDEQESSLKRLVNDLHSAGSASYHKWLTPEQFGKQFGPSDDDVAKLESWLQSKGFTVTQLTPGRQVLEVSGTAGQLRNAFHAQMHQYSVKGVTRYANANAPDIPTALAPVFGGFVSLNNFRLKNHAQVLGKAQLNATTHESKPEWTTQDSSGTHLILAPNDFAVQYDLNPVYAAGTKGDGQTIAIINDSNINVALVNSYRTLFGLPANPPQVIIDGTDPGVDGINSPYGSNTDSGEAYLDVELSGAVAPNAQIDLVIANDTAVDQGLTLAMEHAVYSNIAPVVSLSFGGCESAQGSFNTFISSLWEQAAAQGQTVLVSTGDSGSAGCDDGTQFAVGGQAVNGLASTPYDVAVGGTDFYYSDYATGGASVSNYWNLTPTNDTPTVSLKSVVPEQPWNGSQYGHNLLNFYSSFGETTITAGSGGPSTSGFATTVGTTTTYGPYPKPSWQTGAGDSVRDIPDISLFASNGGNNSYYPICAEDGDCQAVASGQEVQTTGVGGTSASTPSFAAIMALVNEKYGRQGQANYVLYPLAAQFPASFHDVTVGTNTVPCATQTVSSTNSNGVVTTYPPTQCISVPSPITVIDSTYVSAASSGATVEGEISVDGTNAAYNAATGYDLATGLGTVDANNLITNWGNITLASSTTTLTPSVTSFAHGTAVTLSGTVTGSSTPTGDVALVTTSTEPNNQGEGTFPLTGGAFSQSVSSLPGGSYNISGYYSGNGVDGPSSSTPVAITVTPEASATALYLYSGNATIASGGSVQYGAATVLDAVPGSTIAKNTTTVPTGSVAFLDGSATINTAVVTADGNAEYSQPFAIGSHTVKGIYSGDGSYGGSTSATTSFTVVKNTPTILVTAANEYNQTDSNGNVYVANGQVTYLLVQVENSTSASGLAAAPTGTVTMTGGPSGSTTSATLVAGVDPYNNSPQGTAILAVPATASGVYQPTFSYTGGDTNYNAASAQYGFDFVSPSGTSATTTAATASTSATSPTSQITVTATVSSSGSAPTGIVALFDSEYYVGSASLVSATGTSSTATVSVNSSSLFPGNNLITVQYFPTTNSIFKTSAATVTISNPLSDFTMVPLSTILSVPGSGATAGIQTDVINLSSTNGFAGAVSLSCSASGGVACSLSTAVATLASGGAASATLTVYTGDVTAAVTYNVVVTGKNAAGTVIHTLGLTVVTPLLSSTPSFTLAGTAVSVAPGASGASTVTAAPVDGFTGNIALSCAVTSSPSGSTGTPTCSFSPATVSITGAAGATSALTVATSSTTTIGTYVVTVTGTSGSLTASASVAVTVTQPAPASFTLAGTAATVASQGASGTSTITVTPANSFTGTVALTCAVTSAPSGALTSDNPTCSAASASVTGASAATATLTINTTAQTAMLSLPTKRIFTAGGGIALGAMMLFGVPFTRRRKQQIKSLRALRMLSLAILFALAAGAAIGCGSGSSSGGTPPASGGTTTGSYTLTITGTSGSTTATTTIAVTVN